MASRTGMALRADLAQRRIDAALDVLTAQRGITIAPLPAMRRDPIAEPVLRLEWIADTLEQLGQEGGDPSSSEAAAPSVATSAEESEADTTSSSKPRKGKGA